MPVVYKLCPELQLVQSVQRFLSEKKTVDKSDLALKSLFPNPALLNTVQLEAFWLAACQQGCSGTMCVTFSDCHWNYCVVGDLGREE